MRTTTTLDDDLLQRLKREASRAKTTLSATINRVLRLGLERIHPESERPRVRYQTFSMGFPPLHDLDKAMQLAAMLEDEEVVHKLTLGK